MELSPAARARIDRLEQELAALRSENACFKQRIAALQIENAALKQQIADLLRRVGKNSSNSGKPPSSDGLTKKPRIPGSLRSVSGKNSGGQPGHQGDTLRAVDNPDRIERHEATQCRHCQAALTAAMATKVEKRQVFDIPEPRLEVTEHQAAIYTCVGCHGETRAAFPADVTGHVQYGPRLRAAAIYLNAYHLVPEDRTCDALRDLFGAGQLCPASIAAWSEKKAQEWSPVEAYIAAAVAAAAVRNLDETGFRIAGKTRWLHTASTTALTHYRVGERRGDMLITLRDGTIVHDNFKPYFTIPEVKHALCNAHHLRELKALIDFEKEPWARKMSRLLVRAAKQVERAVAKGNTALSEGCAKRIVAVYDTIVARGLAFHEAQPPLVRRAGARGRPPRRVGHNLLMRLRDHKDEVLLFISDFAVPFTNNQAERDLRMMKVKMKISGAFRTLTGAQTFVTLRTVLATAHKQGKNLLATLTATPDWLLRELSG